jgi:hypothetical protein
MKESEMKMSRLILLLGIAALTASGSSMQQVKTDAEEAPKVLFEDPMAENWEDNWFLDGKRATLEHRDGGLAFLTDASNVDKRVDRAAFDAQHAVLWTRQEFEGDIRINYTYTKLPGCGWQKLIYVQAQGIGEDDSFFKDIYTWRSLRDVARMDYYFNYMDLVALSLRDQIRCKRYPWGDITRTDIELQSEFKPRAEHRGLPIGHELDVLVEKRKHSILLRITDAETGELAVDHAWDLTDETVMKNRGSHFVEKGRIGIRLMGGHKILMRDFNVTRLPKEPPPE